VTSEIGSTPRDLLDPEVAEAADMVPFDDLTADVLRKLRAVDAIDVPLSDAADLGVDPAWIGLRGVSAGGGLAAALTLLARDRGELSVAFQLLESPMLDDRQITFSSRQDGLPVWSRSSNTFGWRSYLGSLYGREDVPDTAAPARATDLTGLPPAFVSVGAVDAFRDEDIDYAVGLNQAGVPAELHVYPGACHGFFALAPDASVSQQCKRDMEDWLRRQLDAGR
jgi:acetyl esterase/lipase